MPDLTEAIREAVSDAVRSTLADMREAGEFGPSQPAKLEDWRVRVWTVPPETRIGVPELAEATGRSRDWCYRHTSSKAGPDDRLPCRKLDGELVFVVGEIREWIRGHEDVIHVPRGMLK